jgi:hypothetical protein
MVTAPAEHPPLVSPVERALRAELAEQLNELLAGKSTAWCLEIVRAMNIAVAASQDEAAAEPLVH